MMSNDDYTEEFDNISTMLREAVKLLNNGDIGSAVFILENAVHRAVSLLENENGAQNLGKKLPQRLSVFTNDHEILSAAHVIENLFNPALKPVGLDAGVDEPNISPVHAARVIEYGKKLIEFVRVKITNL